MAPKPGARERDIEEDREDDVVDVVDPNKTDSMLAGDDDDEADDGPDNAIARKQAAEEERRAKARATTEDDADLDADEDARLAYDDEGSGGEERGGRRARRNRAKRLRDEQNQRQIEALTNTVAQQQAALDRISRGQLGLAAGDIDGQIQTLQGHLEQIDTAIEAAISAGDGAKHRQAMRLRDEARDRIQQLGAERYRLAAIAQQSQPAAAQPARPTATAPDPAAVRHSETFLRRHSWFDPDDPTHEDSQIVKAIDDALANEGYKPSTPLYWRELERRVAARGLGKSGDDDVEDDREDEVEERPLRRRTGGGIPPRARGSAGGERPRSRNTLTLDPLMKEALDAEGLLEVKGLTDDQLKLRRKYVKTWSEGLKAAAASPARR